MQRSVSSGFVRQFNRSDFAGLQWVVRSRVCVSGGLYERDGDAVWARQLQHGRCVDVHTLSCRPVRQWVWCDDVDVQRSVCGWSVRCERGSDVVVV